MSSPDSPGSSDSVKSPFRPRPVVGMQRRGEQRMEKFLEAATEVLNEKGYQGARLSDIVKRAGGSMATLYRAFGDKEGLAHALMEQSIHDFGQSVEELLQSTLPPEQALENAACRMVEEILSPVRIACHRIVVSEGPAHPELRDWFLAHGVEPMERLLSQYFAREALAGRLHIDDHAAAAKDFYTLILGGLILRSINGRIDASDIPQAQQHARASVYRFLQGTLPRARPSP